MPAKPENKKCPNCGACQECGHGGTQYVPYPVYPYPPNWYRPYASSRPWYGSPQTYPNTSAGSNQASGSVPIQSWNNSNFTVQ